ncbi:hypothetical protein NKH34_16130 [Mesorhizobium sp. M1148]|uniref:hypothetical protein n=1 Tax=Mesorhizobium sp. M1148 TaxID=2957062 RepID=UPI0003CE45A1|nr:hypothetical protein X749_06545 [Mesorhizobium sp. LNJC391B00]
MTIKEARERLGVALRIGRKVSPPSHAQADMKHRLRRPDRCTIKKRQLFFIDKVLLGRAYPNGASVTFTGRSREDS